MSDQPFQWRTVCALAASAMIALHAEPARAQQSDTLPFRKGQWGAEFTASDFAGIGVLRFTSPRSAWLFDLQGRITRQSGDNVDPAVLPIVQDSDQLQVRFGWRRYGLLAPKVVRHVGLGVLASRTSSGDELAAFSTSAQIVRLSERVNSALGVYAEVGAQWMITRNLSLGASWTAAASGGQATEKSNTTSGQTTTRTTRSVSTRSATLGPLAVRGAVYF